MALTKLKLVNSKFLFCSTDKQNHYIKQRWSTEIKKPLKTVLLIAIQRMEFFHTKKPHLLTHNL